MAEAPRPRAAWGGELFSSDERSGEISWQDRSGFKNTNHRPDLIACPRGGGRIAIEVELTKKSAARLRAILSRHAVWRSLGQTGGVLYVCRDEDRCKRITKHAADVGLMNGRGLRVELLHTIKAQAVAAYEEARANRVSTESAARPPVLALYGS